MKKFTDVEDLSFRYGHRDLAAKSDRLKNGIRKFFLQFLYREINFGHSLLLPRSRVGTTVVPALLGVVLLFYFKSCSNVLSIEKTLRFDFLLEFHQGSE